MKEILIKLPYFSLSQISMFFSSKKVALVNISRLLKNKTIIKIREGYYVFGDYIKKLKYVGNLGNYYEFIATNVIYTPSYLSLEYILFENNILTENVYNFTLVTTKKTAKFKNNFGNFAYKSIKKSFFGDFEIIKKNDFVIYKATKEKALFDYFYFKKDIIFEIKYFEELRLNLENINLKKFEKLVKKYNCKKIKKIFIFLKLLHDNKKY